MIFLQIWKILPNLYWVHIMQLYFALKDINECQYFTSEYLLEKFLK